MSYSKGLQGRMIKRMAGPEGLSAKALSKEVDIPQPTLSRWLKNSSLGAMSNDKGPKRRTRPASEKLRIVVEAGSLNDEKLGELLRREGIHEAELNEWREAMMASLAPPKRKSSKKSPDEKKIRELERDLDRENRALAEVTALLALKKRVAEIWGDEDDDTDGKSDS